MLNLWESNNLVGKGLRKGRYRTMARKTPGHRHWKLYQKSTLEYLTLTRPGFFGCSVAGGGGGGGWGG